MHNSLRKLYRFIVPVSIRKRNKIIPTPNLILRKNILNYYKSLPPEQVDKELSVALDYLRKKSVSIFSDEFQEKYDPTDVEVFTDETLGLSYVLVDNKRLYFKRQWSKKTIQENWNTLLMEQDPESPHRYLTSNFEITSADSVADIGCAEGNFALSIIERVKKIYLFEGDQDWIECIEATFAPWRDKVVIINKLISDKDGENELTVDSYFGDRELSFIKIDVEGFEMKLLNGSQKILKSKSPLNIAVVTYHKQEDALEISQFLKKFDFDIAFSKGYMLFLPGPELKPPYFRKGLIRASKR